MQGSVDLRIEGHLPRGVFVGGARIPITLLPQRYPTEQHQGLGVVGEDGRRLEQHLLRFVHVAKLEEHAGPAVEQRGAARADDSPRLFVLHGSRPQPALLPQQIRQPHEVAAILVGGLAERGFVLLLLGVHVSGARVLHERERARLRAGHELEGARLEIRAPSALQAFGCCPPV